MTSAFSWQNSISLCPASFRIPRPNLPVTPGVSWLPTSAFQSPIMKRTSFFGVLVLKGLVGLHRTVQLQLLQRYWLGHRLGLLWYWMVWLGNEQRSFCRFWDCIQVLHFRLFCWPWWLLHFFWWGQLKPWTEWERSRSAFHTDKSNPSSLKKRKWMVENQIPIICYNQPSTKHTKTGGMV